MASFRNVFFSFHYQRDIFRVNQIRMLSKMMGQAAAGFSDNSLWERARAQGDAALKRLISTGLNNTTVTVVCIGTETYSRRWVNYEIEASKIRGNGLVGVRIHHLVDQLKRTDLFPGLVPTGLAGYDVYNYTNGHDLRHWIELAAIRAGHYN